MIKKNDEVSDESSLNSIGAPNTGNLGLKEEVPCPGYVDLFLILSVILNYTAILAFITGAIVGYASSLKK